MDHRHGRQVESHDTRRLDARADLELHPRRGRTGVIFLAQGVGITPCRSILVHLGATDPDRDKTLVHLGQGHAFRTETQRLARTAIYPTDRDGFQLETKRVVGRHPAATFYLSGTGTFIKSAAEQLKDLGVPRRHIERDQFLGY